MASLGLGSIVDGRYRVVKFLAEGGMGLVWQAVTVPSNYMVVAKEPRVTGRPDVDRVNYEKLQVEASILKLLSHDNIVRFVDLRNVGATPILFTEFVQGENLEKVVGGAPTGEDRAVYFAVQLLSAVEYMHSMNIIHRDIRPKNVIVRQQDNVMKLIDFGTAKFFNNQLDMPEAIIAPGGYSPPEHYHLGYSPQGDIWSIGATLLFLLTARPPSSLMPGYPSAQHALDFSRLNSRVSAAVRAALVRALQYQPSRRFLTAGDMKACLLGTSPAARKNPVLTIRNQEIQVTTRRVVIGRDDRFDFLFSGSKELSLKSVESLRLKPYARTEGDTTLVKLADPWSYISRAHVELLERNGSWYVRDLGSLNGSAVLLSGGWQVISNGRMIQGTPYALGASNVISLGYSTAKGPYVVITFAMSEPSRIEVTHSGLRQ